MDLFVFKFIRQCLNSVELDQTALIEQSDLALHFLPSHSCPNALMYMGMFPFLACLNKVQEELLRCPSVGVGVGISIGVGLSLSKMLKFFM